MNPLLIGLSVAVMLTLLWMGIRQSEHKDLRALLETPDPFELPPGRASRDESFASPQGVSAALEAIVGAALGLGASLERQGDDHAILSLGSRADARMKGLWTLPVMRLPLVLMVRCEGEAQGCRVRMRLDDDFGFQILMGGALRRFHERYDTAFDQIIRAARGACGAQ